MLEDRRLPSTFIVTRTDDDGSAGTLRWAVTRANATPEPNTIDFDATVFGTPQTITLAHDQLELSNTGGAQTIRGPAVGVTVSGGGRYRVFQVAASVTASISGLTITGGLPRIYSPGHPPEYSGIYYGDGGGLDNHGTLTLTGCTISGNSARFGGGVNNDGALTLSGCTISGNSAGPDGGGLANSGVLSLTGCTISGNTSGSGGGLANIDGTATLINCTVSGNSAFSFGGGLYNLRGTMGLTGCTVNGNSTFYLGGGGLVNRSGTASLTDTIVAGNTGESGVPTDIINDGRLSGRSNLIGTGGSGGLSDGVDGNLVDVADPLLGPLGHHGGPTQTIPLLPGSPALDTGMAGPGIPASDQRGQSRHGPPDIGAFESQGFTLTPVRESSPQSAEVGTDFAEPLAVTVVANNPVEPVAGGIVTFSAPNSGATARFRSTGPVVIDDHGKASLTATASTSPGPFTAIASTAGASSPASFALNNEPVQPAFAGLTSPSISYGTARVSFRGILAAGPQTPVGQSVRVTLHGITQMATIQANGSFSTTFDTAALDVAGSPYTVLYSYPPSGDWRGAEVSDRLTVTPATPTLRWANPAAIVYGAVLSAAQLDATAPVPGTFIYTPPAGTILPAGPSRTLSVSFTPTDMANYAAATAAVVIPVDRAEPRLIWPDPPAISFGTALTGTQLEARALGTVGVLTGDLPGTFTYIPAAGTILPAGSNQAISVTFTPDDSANYTTATTTVRVTVVAAPTRTVFTARVIPHGRVHVASIQVLARVESLGPGGAMPTGTVAFWIKKKTVGTATLHGGTAVQTFAWRLVRKQPILVAYEGDPNYQPSRSFALTLTRKSLPLLAALHVSLPPAATGGLRAGSL